MRLTTQKRLASQVLKCSEKKIKLDKTRLDEVKEAITKTDVKSLIKDKAIFKAKTKESSRGRARKKQEQRRKGRSHGTGKRKGVATARAPKKRTWINKIRLQRSIIKTLKDDKKLTAEIYRDLYRKAGGNFFRSKRHLNLYIKEHELINKAK